jgi:hypothetical protein
LINRRFGDLEIDVKELLSPLSSTLIAQHLENHLFSGATVDSSALKDAPV